MLYDFQFSSRSTQIMSVRGWVYVLRNKAIPDLVKVGYSTKDPALRAAELAGTGVPYPYVVEYDVLVESARDVEQAAHMLLWGVHANKEFFKTDVVSAVQAIRLAITNLGQQPLLETESEKLKSLSLQWANKLARRPFAGRNYALACRQCGHMYSIAQIYCDEQGEAECPRCGAINQTPI